MNKMYIGILVIVLLGGLWYWSNTQHVANKGNNESNVPASVERDVSSEDLYTNETYGYSLRIPEELEVVDMTPYSIQIVSKEKEPGQGPANFIYVSVVTPDMKENIGEIYNYNPQNIDKLLNLTVPKSTSLADDEQPELDEWFTYTHVNEIGINGLQAQVFENYKPWEFPAGTTETRYIMKDKESEIMYILGYYTGGDSVGVSGIDPRTARPVIESFQLNN